MSEGAASPELVSKRRSIVPLAIGAVALVGLIAGVIVWSSGGDAGAITLVPARAAGPDPFTESVQIGAVPTIEPPAAAAVAATLTAAPTDEATGLLTTTGTTPGLYGGTNDATSCDPDRLVTFLRGNPTKASAWADALGIEPDRIEEYVAGLTPVVLTADTLVTNHGFKDGRANPIPSVLQAGTAVMVDNAGVPRVKCNCGNPLTPPEPVSLRDADTAGDAWAGYRGDRVAAVRAGDPVESFTLVDLRTGDPITRTAGGMPVVDTGTPEPIDGRWTIELRETFDLTQPFTPGNLPASCPTVAMAGRVLVVDGDQAEIAALGSLGKVSGPVDGGPPNTPGASLGGSRIRLRPDGAPGPEISLAVVPDRAVAQLSGLASLSLNAEGGQGGLDCRVGVVLTREGAGSASVTATTMAATTTIASTLPAGLFCRDLAAQGLNYAAAVEYWKANGKPENMDADGNGIPCETVYPASDVAAIWGNSPTTRPTTAGGTKGSCDRSVLRAAVAGRGGLVDVYFGVSGCDGRFAAGGVAIESDGTEGSWFSEWDGSTWTRGRCDRYVDIATGQPRNDTVPTGILMVGCMSN